MIAPTIIQAATLDPHCDPESFQDEELNKLLLEFAQSVEDAKRGFSFCSSDEEGDDDDDADVEAEDDDRNFISHTTASVAIEEPPPKQGNTVPVPHRCCWTNVRSSNNTFNNFRGGGRPRQQQRRRQPTPTPSQGDRVCVSPSSSISSEETKTVHQTQNYCGIKPTGIKASCTNSQKAKHRFNDSGYRP